jgi:hypothetical protein
LAVAGLFLSGPWPATAAEGAGENKPVTREEYDKVLKELDNLHKELEEVHKGRPLSYSTGAGEKGLEEGSRAPEPGALPEGSSAGGRGGIYDKPFLGRVAPQAYLGGYFEVELRDAEHAPHDFRLHRFVPSIYADIHERVRFASEVEIEDGTKVEVEFAIIDFLISDLVNFRGGVILDPLGKFNLIHDSPINDLTDRPLVDELVIPTTLREIGAGLFGMLTPRQSQWEVKYEAYITSGFKGLSKDPLQAPAITRTEGLAEAKPSEDALGTHDLGDNNNAFAGVGRLSLSPALGSEVGLSAHYGAYDQAEKNDLTIFAVDAAYQIPQFELLDVPIGPIEILGEGAYALIERNAFARARGVPDDLWGYYVQVNYKLMPSFLVLNVPGLFLPASTFTLVGRWDQADLDGSRLHRATVGLNYRIVQSTVVKLDYQFNRGSGLAPDTADDDAFIISLASYF